MVTSKPDSDAIKRQHIIQELYDTERDYHNELQALREKVLPSFKQVRENTVYHIYMYNMYTCIHIHVYMLYMYTCLRI